ncbi:uncharacterized protein V6R79_006051 [Siganus canaliculatus]
MSDQFLESSATQILPAFLTTPQHNSMFHSPQQSVTTSSLFDRFNVWLVTAQRGLDSKWTTVSPLFFTVSITVVDCASGRCVSERNAMSLTLHSIVLFASGEMFVRQIPSSVCLLLVGRRRHVTYRFSCAADVGPSTILRDFISLQHTQLHYTTLQLMSLKGVFQLLAVVAAVDSVQLLQCRLYW